ncbi:MAG: hypothetical protein U1E95_06680 [Rubrivivax sp.]
MADKDIAGMLARHLLPLVQHWYLCDLPLPRAAGAAEIEAVLRRAARAAPVAASRHPSPEQALAAALAAADPVDRDRRLRLLPHRRRRAEGRHRALWPQQPLEPPGPRQILDDEPVGQGLRAGSMPRADAAALRRSSHR